MRASWNASSKSVVRAFVRTSTAISSSAVPPACSSRTRDTTNASSSSGEASGRTIGSSPAGRVAASVFSAPPSRGTSRFASSSTSGDER